LDHGPSDGVRIIEHELELLIDPNLEFLREIGEDSERHRVGIALLETFIQEPAVCNTAERAILFVEGDATTFILDGDHGAILRKPTCPRDGAEHGCQKVY
jgi:hypothetical protein